MWIRQERAETKPRKPNRPFGRALAMAALMTGLVLGTATFALAAHDPDNNPPGPRGGAGTNWENPPGPRGGPGASPDAKPFPGAVPILRETRSPAVVIRRAAPQPELGTEIGRAVVDLYANGPDGA